MSEKGKEDLTRERLLNEAEALFAHRGYDGVSVREITAAAGSNLAAVNYHFGNKENLYLEVFRSRWVPRAKRVQDHFRKSLEGRDRSSPTTVVNALAEAFLAGPLSDDERQRHHQLMARELGRPTDAFRMLAAEIMRPFFKELADMLRASLPRGIEEEQLLLNILSIFANVLYFNFARTAVSHITGRTYDERFKAQLVEHIVRFSLNGLKGSQG